MLIDAVFPVRGECLSADSLYWLYSALSHLVPAFHDPGSRVRFSAIGGEVAGKGLVRLTSTSCLRVRLPAEQVATVLPLASSKLQVGEHHIHLGVPTVRALCPATALQAR